MRYFQVLCKFSEDEDSRICYRMGIRNLSETTRVLCNEFDDEVASFLLPAEDMSRDYGYINIMSKNNYITEKQVRNIAEHSLCEWELEHDLNIVQIFEKSLYDTGFFPHITSESQRITRWMPCMEFRDLIYKHKRSVIENLAIPKSESDCYSLIEGTPWETSLKHEIGRIFDERIEITKTLRSNRTIQPVHYIIDSANNHMLDKAISAITSSKIKCGTLVSKRVFEIDLDLFGLNEEPSYSRNDINYLFTDSLGYALSGNTVVLKYGRNDFYGNYDVNIFNRFNLLIEILKPYVMDTLLIFAINGKNDSLVYRLENMLDLPVVNLSGEYIDKNCLNKEDAKKYFALKAKSDNLKIDLELEKMYDETTSLQNMISVDSIYDTWRAKSVSKHGYEAELNKFIDNKSNINRKMSAMEKLDALIGLKCVKDQIKEVISCMSMNKVKQSLGVETEKRTLHLAFKGEPGTGKTEVAKIYAEILKEAGILKKGTLVIKNGSDWDIDKGFEEAKGGILFIDEAYALFPFTEQITRLIANMENKRDECVVILAGYEDEINLLISKNPGFKSRIGFEINFPNYTPEELLAIFKLMCKKHKIKVERDALCEVDNVINRAGRRSDQGNARFVRKLFEDVCMSKDCRLAKLKENNEIYKFDKEELLTVTKDDVLKSISCENERNAWEELDEMIGLKDVKKQVKKIVTFNKIQKIRRERGIDSSFLPMHMAFTGNPGTGKTDVARLIGRILKQEGLLSVGDFKECNKGDLMLPFSGGSSAVIDKLFDSSIGGVIFIDEAYSLFSSAGGCESEMIAALIANMENHRDEVVVIFAGYEKEMDNLFRSNEGFASRIKSRIKFPDYSPQEMCEIFDFMANKKGFELDEGVHERVIELFREEAGGTTCGNARFVRNVLDETIMAQSLRISGMISGGDSASSEVLQKIKCEDITLPDNVLPSKKRTRLGFVA